MAKGKKTPPRPELYDDEAEEETTLESLLSLLKDSQEEKEARAKYAEAAETAGRYLKLAALARAKEMLGGVIPNQNDSIARVETMLRAARHVCRTSGHYGDPIPSIRRKDGTLIPLTARLLELMDCDSVLQANTQDDDKSPSKTSKISKAGREARVEIVAKARQVIDEGEIVA